MNSESRVRIPVGFLYVHLGANTLGKAMNSSTLLKVMGWITGDNGSYTIGWQTTQKET